MSAVDRWKTFPAGATKLPPPVNVNLDEIMNKNPLITDFPPLPSRDLIYAARDRIHRFIKAKPGPVSIGIPILPGLVGIGVGPSGGGSGETYRRQAQGPANDTRKPPHAGSKTQTTPGTRTSHNAETPPTPTPSRKKKRNKDKGNG